MAVETNPVKENLLIFIEDVCLTKGRVEILKNVSASANEGEVLALLGPNGAGKTSLLRLLSNELEPTSGTLRINDKPVSSYRPQELARMRGYLPQTASLSFGFRVVEVVELGRLPHPMEAGSSSSMNIVYQAMEYTGILHLAERNYTTLSGGEKQRVQLARVFAQIWEAPSSGKRVLLLDEPVAALDLMHQHTVLSTAAEFARKGTAVILVLHDLNMAAMYSDKALLLKGGEVVDYGVSADVLSVDNIRNTFRVEASLVQDPNWGRQIISTRL